MELRALRSRLNGLVVQHVISLGLATGLLVSTVLIVFALRASPTLFTAATWGGTVIGVGLAAYLVWLIRRAWLSLDDAAYLADQRSGLEGRLTTVLADPAPHSPLRSLLLEQVRAAAPRWRTSTLAPQRIARSMLLIPAALGVLAASAFYARPPAHMVRASQPWQPLHQEDLMVASAAGPGAAPTDGAQGDAGLRKAGASTNDAGEPRDGPAGAPSTADAPGTQNMSTGTTSASADAAAAGNGLRDSIRRALGADPDSAAGADHPSHATGASNGASNAVKEDEHRSAADASAGSAPSAGAMAAPDTTAPTDPSQPGPQQAPAGAEDRGGTGRSGAGGAAGELFDTKVPAVGAPTSGAAKPMAIKLGAFAAAAPQQAEPQRRRGPPVAVSATSAGGNTRLPDIAAEQAPDAALQKLDVAPEHEAFVRRIFTRE
jgi:hypothetical protein